MARFPHYKENTKALGRLLAEASVNPALRRKLQCDPSTELRRIGLPPETTELFNFKVVTEEQREPFAVLPYRLNQERLGNRDPEYLATIADTVMAGTVN
jgi:hypothetical protein